MGSFLLDFFRMFVDLLKKLLRRRFERARLQSCRIESHCFEIARL
jgi:hypothetical protein